MLPDSYYLSAMASTTELTILEERFCEAFVKNGGNATGAYMRAFRGFVAPDYAVGAKMGYELVQRPEIQVRILELRADLETANHAWREEILGDLCAYAFRDGIEAYLDYDETSVTLKPLSELTPRQAKAIRRVKIDAKTGFPIIEFEPRIDALREIGRILGYYQNNMKIDVTKRFVIEAPATIPDMASWERLAQHSLDLPAQRLDESTPASAEAQAAYRLMRPDNPDDE